MIGDDCAVVVQARLSSTRFPRKILYPIAGRPMLSHVLERVRSFADQTGAFPVLAMPVFEDPADLAAIQAIVGEDWPGPKALLVCPNGPPVEDVLQRFVLAIWCASAVSGRRFKRALRVTSDCPFWMPSVGVACLKAQEPARPFVFAGAPDFPDGFDAEVMTVDDLVEAFAQGPDEHVTTAIRAKYGEGARLRRQVGKIGQPKLSVDSPNDAARAQFLMRLLGSMRLIEDEVLWWGTLVARFPWIGKHFGHRWPVA